MAMTACPKCGNPIGHPYPHFDIAESRLHPVCQPCSTWLGAIPIPHLSETFTSKGLL